MDRVSTMKKQFFSYGVVTALLALSMGFPQVHGAVFDLDFNSDPDELGILFTGSSEWVENEGVDDSGFLAVTYALNDQRGAIIFPDLEEGAALTAFDISADLRVGGGTDMPADGFSFNFARPDDPVLDEDNEFGGIGEGYASSPTDEVNLPEEGTTTGLAIGFDEWFSGGDDVIGMSIRIDNELVEQIPFPTMNGDADDPTSLQTGPAGVDYLELGWAKLELSLSSANNLTIVYKGLEVYNEVIEYEPSPGLLVFAGRTGGSNAAHHIDNISIRTNADATGGGGGGGAGDFNLNGVLDLSDIDDLTGQSAAQTNAAGYDLNADSLVNDADIGVWVKDLRNSWIGDANLDGEFNSADLVNVLASGTYEADLDSVWSTGDFNGDGRTNSSDLVAALSDGGYEMGPRGAVAAVPEPSSCALILAGLLSWIVTRRAR
jgi:hypothetical protein